jgi:hypothetical protein
VTGTHRFSLAVALLATGAEVICAQGTTTTNPPGKLAFILPSLLDQALGLAPTALRPTIAASISPRWVSLNASVATQLSNLPSPSPASSVRWVWDEESGTFKGTPQSWGPILAERPETLGRNRFFFDVTNMHFSFDRLDDLDLRGFQVAYPITVPAGTVLPIDIPALLSADAYINVKLDETTVHLAYGMTHWMDASVAFPIVTSSVTIRGGASLRELLAGTTLVTLPTQMVQLSSTGPGDVMIRLKANLSRPKRPAPGTKESDSRPSRFKFAMALDMRLPTGDEFDYHGAGAFGIKPILIASMTNRFVSPHLNAGFQWNGESYLASPFSTEKRHLPSQLFYAAGFDAGLSPRMTLAFDFLDQRIIRGQRSLLRPFQASDGTTSSEIFFQDITHHEYNASMGFKAQIANRTVVTANMMLRLNDAGLRARVVPLIGISHLF